MGLHRPYVGHRHGAGEKRIFAHVLEVATALRYARHVHARPFDDVNANIDTLSTHEIAVRGGLVGVERRGQSQRSHDGCCFGYRRAISLTYPYGPIADAERGNGESRNSGNVA